MCCKCLLHHQIAKLGEAYRGACADAQEMSALAHAQHSRGDCAAELRRLGYTRRCYICQEDAVFDMLRCPECGESVCASCVSQLAHRFCAPDTPKHVRELSGGEVSCLACGHGRFTLSTLRHRLDNETFEAVLLRLRSMRHCTRSGHGASPRKWVREAASTWPYTRQIPC